MSILPFINWSSCTLIGDYSSCILIIAFTTLKNSIPGVSLIGKLGAAFVEKREMGGGAVNARRF